MWVIVATIWMSTLIFQNVSGEIDEETDQHQYRSSKFSVGFHLLLPVAGLILIVLGRKQIFERILLQLDKRYLTVVCPNFIKKEALLKWACSRLPPTWTSYSTKTLSGGIKDLWTDGSLLCTLINTGVPGACPNPHRHWKQPPTHAQALAYKYFGVPPLFSNEELNKKLTSTLDRKFLRYLSDIQQSINRTSDNERESKISDRYIVRGMGLFSGEQYKTAEFYIYLDENVDDDNESNIIIQIKGPFGSFGEAIAPKLINKKRKRRPIKAQRRSSLNLIENLQSLQSNIINFTRSPKKTCGEEIDVEAILEIDRIKVVYFPKHHGMYEIHMVGGGEILKCSPFNVHIFAKENTVDELALGRKQAKTIRKVIGKFEEKTSVKGIHSIQNEIIYEEKVTSTKSRIEIKDVVNQIRNEDTWDCTDNVKNNVNTKPNISVKFNRDKSQFNENNTDKFKPSLKDNQKGLKTIINNNIEDKNLSEDNHNINKTNQNYATNIHYEQERKDKIPKSDTKSTIIEKINFFDTKNKESTGKIENVLVQEKISVSNDPISTNNNILNKQISNGGNNLKSNNVVSEPISNSKQLISENKQVDRNSIKNIFENNIKIPDRLINDTVKNYANKLEDKYFKNIVNESNKLQIKDDINNNSIKDRVQMYLEKLETDSGINGNTKKATSPICSDHIVPEVDYYKKMNVAEKRKIFARSSLESEPISNNSSFSENESSLGSNVKKFQSDFKILNDTGQSINSNKDCWSLCSTVSLPNLSMESDCSSIGSVKDKKFFWENISSRSSSSVSGKRKDTPGELERSKLIWKKTDKSTVKEYNDNIFKSADDILSMTESVVRTNIIKYQSVDVSLDKCTFLSIQERKKLLLKQSYEIEKITVTNNIDKNKDNPQKKDEKLNVRFTPIYDKIKRYNSASQLSTGGPVKEQPKEVRKIKSFHTSQIILKKDEIDISNKAVHHKFNAAIKYFKNLETQSQNIKTGSKKLYDSINKKPTIRYRSGSLNIPNVSDRYSINNLYDDVFGNKGSFKGTPNRSAVVKALATFSKTSKLENNDNEDNIKYDIFKHVKRRKRKSLNSIFDVFY